MGGGASSSRRKKGKENEEESNELDENGEISKWKRKKQQEQEESDDDEVEELIQVPEYQMKVWIGPKPTASGGMAQRPQQGVRKDVDGLVALKWSLLDAGTSYDAPCARASHISWFIDETPAYEPTFTVFGGVMSENYFNQPHSLTVLRKGEDLIVGEWEKQSNKFFKTSILKKKEEETISPPMARIGARAIRVGEACIVVFGGFSGLRTYTNDLHVYHGGLRSWYAVEAVGTPPCPRKGFAIAEHNGKVLIHGGFDGSNLGKGSIHSAVDAYLDDLIELDCTSLLQFDLAVDPAQLKEAEINRTAENRIKLEWQPVRMKNGRFKPSPRYNHSLVTISTGKVGRYFMFGGVGPGMKVSNDHLLLEEYYRVSKRTGEASRRFRFRQVRTTGKIPCPRGSHISLFLPSNTVIVYGGYDEYYKVLPDFLALDLDTLVWRKLIGSGTSPPARADFSAVATNGARFIIYGGYGGDKIGYLKDTWSCELLSNGILGNTNVVKTELEESGTLRPGITNEMSGSPPDEDNDQQEEQNNDEEENFQEEQHDFIDLDDSS